MKRRLITIPDWMIKTLKDDSKLRRIEVVKILGYKSINSINTQQIRILIEKGEFPPTYSRGNCGFGLSPYTLLWEFGEFKKWVNQHNQKLKEE